MYLIVELVEELILWAAHILRIGLNHLVLCFLLDPLKLPPNPRRNIQTLEDSAASEVTHGSPASHLLLADQLGLFHPRQQLAPLPCVLINLSDRPGLLLGMLAVQTTDGPKSELVQQLFVK